jgi:hypothetical protein
MLSKFNTFTIVGRKRENVYLTLDSSELLKRGQRVIANCMQQQINSIEIRTRWERWV